MGQCGCVPGVGGFYCIGSDLYQCTGGGTEWLMDKCASAASCAEHHLFHCGCATLAAATTPLVPLLKKQGAPSFKVVGVALFAATLGSATQLEQTPSVLDQVLSPHHEFDPSKGLIGPKTQHSPPYDSELSSKLAAAGYVSSGTFADCQLFSPKGLVLMLMIAPESGAPSGTSFDLANGPIIPNSSFPMSLGTDLYREGVLIDPTGDGSFPPSSFVTPGTDGYSHAIYAWSTGVAFIPPETPVKGSYVWRVDLTSPGQGGWQIDVPFVVQ